MKQGIADGTITAERLDDAVHRILGLKAMRGLHQLTFPDKVIRSHGMVPGIWFEPETVGKDANVYDVADMLLTSNLVICQEETKKDFQRKG